jgi:hypothetical protein
MNATYRTTEYLGSETATGLTFDEVADLYESCGFGEASDVDPPTPGGRIYAGGDVIAFEE